MRVCTVYYIGTIHNQKHLLTRYMQCSGGIERFTRDAVTLTIKSVSAR